MSEKPTIQRLEDWLQRMQHYTDQQYGKGDIKQLIADLKKEEAMNPTTKVRDCSFEVDYTLAELQSLQQWIDDLDEIKEKTPDSLPKGVTDAQRLLKNMKSRLLYSYKIPLSEETRKAFHAAEGPVASPDDFLHNTLPDVAHSLLYSMLNNYCSCKAEKPEGPLQRADIVTEVPKEYRGG